MTKFIRPIASLIAFGWTAAAVYASSTDLDAAKIREQANELLGPLPAKAPGSEKDTPELVKLGEKLYFEKRLSVNNTMSCNSCHRLDEKRGGVDNEPTSPGAFGKRGGRNAPTVLNAAFQIAQFWDGRAENLEAQAKGPILNPIEMAMPGEKEVLARLSALPEYRDLFGKAFPSDDQRITYDNLARAIAAFERTLITRDRFDGFLKGDDNALNRQELRGLKAFMDNGCTTCHFGPAIGGALYQKMGLVNPYETADLGRYEVTKNDEDKFKFKVPMLRNIALTGPYFHDGKSKTLEETVKTMAWVQLGKRLGDEEAKDIVAFLRALTDKARATK